MAVSKKVWCRFLWAFFLFPLPYGLFVEIYYVFTVLMTKLGTLPYEPQKMKKTTILMLILNCLLLVCCSAAVGMFEDWVPQGYITLADILRFTSVPGMAIKMVALAGQL